MKDSRDGLILILSLYLAASLVFGGICYWQWGIAIKAIDRALDGWDRSIELTEQAMREIYRLLGQAVAESRMSVSRQEDSSPIQPPTRVQKED